MTTSFYELAHLGAHTAQLRSTMLAPSPSPTALICIPFWMWSTWPPEVTPSRVRSALRPSLWLCCYARSKWHSIY